jgi:hypothetical protein
MIRTSYIMTVMYHFVQIEDPSDDPREFQQHAPGSFADDEMPQNLGGLIGARVIMDAVQHENLFGENALSCIGGRSSTSFTYLPS